MLLSEALETRMNLGINCLNVGYSSLAPSLWNHIIAQLHNFYTHKGYLKLQIQDNTAIMLIRIQN